MHAIRIQAEARHPAAVVYVLGKRVNACRTEYAESGVRRRRALYSRSGVALPADTDSTQAAGVCPAV
jgi:hypothetical protein